MNWKNSMAIKADENYRKNHCVNINHCLKCIYNRGYFDDSTMKCKRLEDVITLAMIRPANYLKGFKNGDIIVDCKLIGGK